MFLGKIYIKFYIILGLGRGSPFPFSELSAYHEAGTVILDQCRLVDRYRQMAQWFYVIALEQIDLINSLHISDIDRQ